MACCSHIKRRAQGPGYSLADPRAYTDRLNQIFTASGWTRQYSVHTVSPLTRMKKDKTSQTGNLRDRERTFALCPQASIAPGGLIRLGCTHAQPKKSAVPIFTRMLASHQRSLIAAHEHNEPAGQVACRELEIVRIKGALQRSEELSDDAAVAIEGVI